MFPLAGQTAGPNGLIFLWTLMGSLGVTKIFFTTGNAGSSASFNERGRITMTMFSSLFI